MTRSAEELRRPRGGPCPARNDCPAARLALEDAGSLALRDCIDHALNIGAAKIPRGDRADRRLDMPINAPLVDLHGCRPLGGLEPIIFYDDKKR